MAEFTVDHCKSCDARIIWAVTERGKSMPVDADPVADEVGGGNVQLVPQADGRAPLAKVLSVAAQFGKTNLRLSHFATCKFAAQHRGAGKGRRS